MASTNKLLVALGLAILTLLGVQAVVKQRGMEQRYEAINQNTAYAFSDGYVSKTLRSEAEIKDFAMKCGLGAAAVVMLLFGLSSGSTPPAHVAEPDSPTVDRE